MFPPRPTTGKALQAAIEARNAAWKGNPLIPHWVRPHKVDLDRFFTRPAVARDCYAFLLEIMGAPHADAGRCKFVEPAAGEGVFYDLLPAGRRIGIEVVPGRVEFEQADFLSWQPPVNGHRFVAVGNPPFGYRA